jgi:hypothetical protein
LNSAPKQQRDAGSMSIAVAPAQKVEVFCSIARKDVQLALRLVN